MQPNCFSKMEKIAPIVLRVGMALVFFYFGISQLLNPSQWTGFLPAWVSIIPISGVKFILLNGLFEVVGATLLLVGAFARIVAFLLAVHLFGITATIGFSATGARDFGLSVATFVVALLGAGEYSIDSSEKVLN